MTIDASSPVGSQFTIRPMRKRDIAEVARLEEEVYPQPWSIGVFRDELRAGNRTYLVVIDDSQTIVAYGGLLLVEADAHITTVAVDPSVRRKRLGTRIMLALIDAALATGADHLTLEVRMSNAAAQRLYDRFGFCAPFAPGSRSPPMAEPLVLGIETSCDETGIAVVRGYEVLSSVLGSQTDEHARFGGVVPEVAARAHVEAIRPLAHEALREAGVHSDQIDAVAATRGPGLAGALLVGVSFAKALAWSLDKPFLGVDHMEGHLFAPRLEHAGYAPPAVVLLASGGHSQIVHMREWGDYEVLGQTIDDAAGEAFDKLARYMGLGFPGGPAIDRAAEDGDPEAVSFPRALRDRPYDFSFSGLKTSVITYLEKAQAAGSVPPLADVAASIQEAIVDVLVDKTFNAVDATGATAVGGGGGVLANRRLRARFAEEAAARGIALFLPAPILCTDNGAMIGAVGSYRLERGDVDTLLVDVEPSLRLG